MIIASDVWNGGTTIQPHGPHGQDTMWGWLVPPFCYNYILNEKSTNLLKIAWALLKEKKVSLFIGFLVLQMASLSSQFQCKNRFWKICTESQDICQFASKFKGLVCQILIHFDYYLRIQCKFFKSNICVEIVSSRLKCGVFWCLSIICKMAFQRVG